MNNNGYYSVGNQVFGTKIEALIKATETNTEINYHFYDEIFDAVNIDTIKNLTLTDLYRQRALQLRDTYDYLILHYSGGSDSHNVLHTFLKNKIKLDHVYVYWHTSLTDKNLYNPNSENTGNENYHSEWDLVIKKDLEWLAFYHPEITIEVKDWTKGFNEDFYNDSTIISKVGNPTTLTRSKKLYTFSDIETKMADKGLKVASIYGSEKPFIVWKENKFFYYFKDRMGVNQPNPKNPFGCEYFYTTPNFPELTVAQSYQVANFFKNNLDKFFLIKAPSLRSELKNYKIKDYYTELEDYSECVKFVCYPNWDFNRFQAGKPCPGENNLPIGLKSWDIILQKAGMLDRTYLAYRYYWNSYYKLIDQKYFKGNEEVVLKTKWHFLEDFTPSL